jgi:O-methyltransferase involved in polyketide biosynthesis
LADISKWSNLSRSLLLPLYFRAAETKRDNPILIDDKAEEIIKSLDFDFSMIDGYNIIQTATVMRESVFDDLAKDFLAKNPESVVINIGSGLDTRFFRLDNKKVIWYELDLPEVINVRKDLFSETSRYKFISCSAFDEKWMKKIENKNLPILLLAEGFLFYFSKDKAKKLILDMKQNFPGADFLFDAVTPLQAALSRLNPALELMDVWFKWGLGYTEELASWDSHIQTKDVVYYFNPSFERLGWYSWYCLLPAVRFGFYIVSCALGKK